jgi:hypothetical protein
MTSYSEKPSAVLTYSLGLIAMIFCAHAYSAAIYVSSTQTPNASVAQGDPSYGGSFDLNAIASAQSGMSIDLTTGQYFVFGARISLTYTQDLVDPIYDFLGTSANGMIGYGPTNVTVDGNQYYYQETFLRYDRYQAINQENAVGAISVGGEELGQTSFDSTYSYSSVRDQDPAYSIPSDTVGLILFLKERDVYTQRDESGSRTFALNPLLNFWDSGILNYEFDTTFGALTLNQVGVSLSYQENPDWLPPAEVPIVPAGWLFGSALLGLGAMRRRKF